MERVLTQEERIRRAQEIYLRRRTTDNSKETNRNTNINDTRIKFSESKIKVLKKVALQIIICLLLYCIFYLIYDTNYSFSDTTINEIDNILNYDINFEVLYKYINDRIQEIFGKQRNIIENNEITEESLQENTKEQNTEKIEETIQEVENTQENNNLEEITKKEETKEVIKEDNYSLKDKYKLIYPVNGGYISSRFGAREATSEIMSTNHKGIDIAVAKRY